MAAGLAEAVALVSFWLLVPDTRAERRQSEDVVFATGLLWLTAQVTMLPAILGIHVRFSPKTGALGGAGAALAALGSAGLIAYLFFLFPELVGFRPDTIDKAQIALALEATGELGAAAFLGGWLCIAAGLLRTRAMNPLPATLVVIGSVVVPLGLLGLQWLALGACLLGLGIAWTGVEMVINDVPPARPQVARLGSGDRSRRFRF